MSCCADPNYAMPPLLPLWATLMKTPLCVFPPLPTLTFIAIAQPQSKAQSACAK